MTSRTKSSKNSIKNKIVKIKEDEKSNFITPSSSLSVLPSPSLPPSTPILNNSSSYSSLPFHLNTNSLPIDNLKEFYQRAFLLNQELSHQFNSLSSSNLQRPSSSNLQRPSSSNLQRPSSSSSPYHDETSNNFPSSSSTTLLSPSSSTYLLKLHGKKILKVYKALLSLLYSSISLLKINEVETFIRNLSATLPTSLIDLTYWENVLKYAKFCRENCLYSSNPNTNSFQTSTSSNGLSSSLQDINDKLKVTEKKLNLTTFLCLNPIRNIKDEFNLLKSSIEINLNTLKQEIFIKNQLILQLLNKFNQLSNNSNSSTELSANVPSTLSASAVTASSSSGASASASSSSTLYFPSSYSDEILNKQQEQIKTLQENNQKLSEKNQKLNFENNELTDKTEEFSKKIEELQYHIKEYTIQNENLLKKLKQLEQENQKIQELEQEIQEISLRNNQLEQENKEISNKNKDLLVSNEELSIKIDEILQNYNDIKMKYEELLRSKDEARNFEDEHEEGKIEFDDENERMKHETEMKKYDEEKKKHEDELKKIDDELKKFDEETIKYEEELKKHDEEKKKIEEESNRKDKYIAELEARIKKYEEDEVERKRNIQEEEEGKKLIEEDDDILSISNNKLDEDDEEELRGLLIKNEHDSSSDPTPSSPPLTSTSSDTTIPESSLLLLQAKEYIDKLTEELEKKDKLNAELLFISNNFQEELRLARLQLQEASQRLENQLKVDEENNNNKLEENSIEKKENKDETKEIQMKGPSLRELSSAYSFDIIDSTKLCFEIIENFKKSNEILIKQNKSIDLNNSIDTTSIKSTSAPSSFYSNDHKKLQQQHHQLIQAFYVINEQLMEYKREASKKDNTINAKNNEYKTQHIENDDEISSLINSNTLIINNLERNLTKFNKLKDDKKLSSSFLYSSYFITDLFSKLLLNSNKLEEIKYSSFIHNITKNEDFLNNIRDDYQELMKKRKNNENSIDNKENNEDTSNNLEESKQETIIDENLKEFHHNIVKIQSQIRGYLTRENLKNQKIDKIAQESGVLVAIDDTEQGETGWYTIEKKIYYFCLHDGEFVLLCGPLTTSEYRKAKKQLSSILVSKSNEINLLDNQFSIESIDSINSTPATITDPNSTASLLHTPVTVDISSVYITRYQIDSLLRDIKNKKEYIKELEDKLNVKNNK